MSILDWILLISIFVLLISLIAFGIYNKIAPSPYTYLSPLTGDLGSEKNTYNDKTIANFVKGGEGTISVFLYLNPTQRTSSVSVHPKNDITDNSPLDKENNFTVFSLGNFLMFKQYPSGASDKESAQLQIITVPTTRKTELETFTFTPIPKQQWTCVTISRVGRRFTVYYNNTMVSSFRTKYYHVIDKTYEWQIGVSSKNNSGGAYAYPYAGLYALNEQEIQKQMNYVSDTRHKPILPKPGITNFFSMFGGCPDGVFCYTKPETSNPINAWTSPFA